MPLNLGHRRRRQPNGDEETNPSSTRGWANIEDYIFTHDDEMISDFADDIDTLLVFAGLFSAIVTAFVIVSFTMLQPDNTQLSVQLLSVLAIQSGGFAGSESFLNSTATTLPSSTSFQAPTSAITINSLWFTSLILSLASALYGILAKQWCREYLKWYAVLSPSARENVLVRHVRFEAWERWKVPALIGAIPALLETALVLFLSGLIVFLWTLEKTVAIILTLFIGLSLAFALVTILLPVFSPRCPYRSPTAWAFTKLWYLVFRGWRSLKGNRGLRLPRNWRELELYTLDHPRGVVSLAQKLGDRWTYIFPDSLQVEVLLRVLTWAHRGSGEGQLADDISQCTLSLHRNYTDGYQDINVLSTLQALDVTSRAKIRLSSFQHDFVGPMCKRLIDSRLSQAPRGFAFRSVSLMEDGCSYLGGPFINHPLAFGHEDHLQYHPWISRRLLLQDLTDLVTQWIQDISHSDAFGSRLTTRHMEMVVMLLCLLRCYGIGVSTLDKRDAQDLTYTLCAIYRKLGPIDAAYKTGLISMVAEILCFTGEVKVDCRDWTVSISRLVNPPSAGLVYTPRNSYITGNLTSFAHQVYEQNPEYSRPNNRQLFVMAADAAVRFYLNAFHEYTVPSNAILSCMLDAAQISLSKAYRNCGASVDLPWIASLVDRFQFIRQELGITSVMDSSFRKMLGDKECLFQLLSVIQASLRMGLITGERAQEQLDELLQLIGNPELPVVGHTLTDDDVPSGQPPEPTRYAESLMSPAHSVCSLRPSEVRSRLEIKNEALHDDGREQVNDQHETASYTAQKLSSLSAVLTVKSLAVLDHRHQLDLHSPIGFADAHSSSPEVNNSAPLSTEIMQSLNDPGRCSAQHDTLSSSHLFGPSPSMRSMLGPNDMSSAVTTVHGRSPSNVLAIAPAPALQPPFSDVDRRSEFIELGPLATSSSNATYAYCNRSASSASSSPPAVMLTDESGHSPTHDILPVSREHDPFDMV